MKCLQSFLLLSSFWSLNAISNCPNGPPSKINIVSDSTIYKENNVNVTFQFAPENYNIAKVKDEFYAYVMPGSTAKFNSSIVIDDVIFVLERIKFISLTSYHSIDGEKYDSEINLQFGQYGTQTMAKLMVVSVLLKENAEVTDPESIQHFHADFSTNNPLVLSQKNDFSLESLIEDETRFYRYSSKLDTTCEDVERIVFPVPLLVSPAFIKAIDISNNNDSSPELLSDDHDLSKVNANVYRSFP